MTLRLLLIGDVGDADFHVGDEAMFETAVREVSHRGDVHLTAVASGPDAVAHRYCVAAVAQLGFDQRRGAAFDDARDARLHAVLDGTADDPAAVAWRDAVDQSDAVLVCGGGNLCSSWPHLVYERIALLRAAIDREVPVVLVGQSVGPHLSVRQAEWLAPLFESARLVGVRDPASRTFVLDLSPDAPVVLHVDDAIALPSGTPWDGAPDSYVAMAVHRVEQPATGALHDALRMLVRSVRDSSGADVVILPNTGSLDGASAPGTDADFVAEWSATFGADDGVHVAPVLPNRQFAATLRGSLAVVSSRFHPIVFGLGAAIPCIGLTSDRYTARKISGALAHAGMDGWRLPIASLGSEIPNTLFADLVHRRAELVDHLVAVTAPWPERHSARWDVVWQCLAGERPSLAELHCPDLPSGPTPTTDTALLHRLELGWYDRDERNASSSEAAEEYALSLQSALDQTTRDAVEDRRAFERELAVRQDRLTDLADELAREQRSADTARKAAARAYRELATFEPVVDEVDREYLASLERELAAMRSTRLFRWTRPLRAGYGWIRRSGTRRRA